MNHHITTSLASYRDSHFELNFISNCIFEIKKPAECTIVELHNFYIQLKKGNKVSLTDLHQKIFNAEYLGFCYQGEKLVGISAIKKPTRYYMQDVYKKAGIVRNAEGPVLEIGYSFTEELVRQKGISTKLKTMLLAKIKHHKGIICATTATPSSQRFLMAQGFKACGHPYRGIFDDQIVYFESRFR